MDRRSVLKGLLALPAVAIPSIRPIIHVEETPDKFVIGDIVAAPISGALAVVDSVATHRTAYSIEYLPGERERFRAFGVRAGKNAWWEEGELIFVTGSASRGFTT